MMSFINENRIKHELLQQVNRVRHSYEPLDIKVYLLVVARAHFAEAREIWSKLFQQSTEGHRDQHLGNAAQTLRKTKPTEPSLK